MNSYEQLLREYKIKVTPQRLSIVEELYGCVHMSIDELYEAIKKKFPSVSLATVYKNINTMLDSNFIQEVKIPNEKSKYELTKEAHSHVVCQECGRVEDIILDLHTISQKAANLSHYQIKEEALVFSGLCPECKAS
jgi:Fur family peroxide stress response transcriptional regulator